MISKTKKIQLNNQVVLCMDLTYGFLTGLAAGTIEDSEASTVMNGTMLSEDEVMKLRGSEITALYEAICQLTYPHAYNEDGTLKPFDTESEADDKKKL